MEQADQTLHDFVLNLLSDSQALAAFEQDPAAVLDHAGLSDISAVDIREVMPLVIDYVPAHAEALDAVLGRLPLDSVDTGQLGAIQQLQFVTHALGGLPAFDDGGTFGNSQAGGAFHLTSDGQGGVWGLGELNSPLGDAAGSLTGNMDHGLTGTVWDQTAAGHGTTSVNVPGLDSVPGLGGGLPSGFSALSDVTDVLDGHTSSVTGTFGNSATAAANLLTGAADLTAGALANPTDLAGALSNPVAAVSALAGTGDTFAMYGAQALPAPAGAAVGQVVQTAGSASQGVVGDVSSHLQSGPLGDVTSHLPAADPTHALSSVQGVVDQVTGSLGSQLPTGALSDVTSHVTDPTHAVQSTVTSLQGAVSDTVGNVASHSAVSDITGSTGTGSALGSGDHTDVTGDLGHVASDLHLPSLF
jgi:hypothetical protein